MVLNQFSLVFSDSPMLIHSWSMKLTTHRHLVPRLRIKELYLYSPNVFMAWCVIKKWIHLHGLVINKTQGQLYLLLSLYRVCGLVACDLRGSNFVKEMKLICIFHILIFNELGVQ